ncbi:unnamed protein product [Rhizophagus irregularis]|uniref:Uncharacterized protein n=1 Tax=Rhizophagus irregularis TaxID=588596 RepID=A0A915ZA77_9GLOM|nr:unnamed protein product [Rhizophagus irregularis]
MSLDNIGDAIPEEPNELSEEERDNLYAYLTHNDTNLANVEKLLNLCKTNNAKLVSVSGNKRRKISEFEGDTGDNGSLAKAFMMLVTNYPPSSSVVATMICPVSFMQICDSLSEKQVISGSIHEFRDYLGRDDVWYIVDARKLKEYRGKTTLQSLLDAGINKVNANIMSFVGETTQGNDISHRLVHICTNVSEEEEAEEGKVDLTFSESSISINLEPLTISNFSEPSTSFTSFTSWGPSNKPSVAQNDNEGVRDRKRFD